MEEEKIQVILETQMEIVKIKGRIFNNTNNNNNNNKTDDGNIDININIITNPNNNSNNDNKNSNNNSNCLNEKETFFYVKKKGIRW